MKLVVRNKILIAPLDWGLGHATRCIPLIYALIKGEQEVVVAADGPLKILLQEEFPEIEYIPLPGYRIKYSKTQAALFIVLIRQIPKLLKSISSENRWLTQAIKKHKIDIVISDNRFGLYNKEIYSVFITHQLQIRSSFFQTWLRKINYYFINKFDECWVPDFDGDPNLAGVLSHPKKFPTTPVRYIGWLSRFEKRGGKDEKHLLIMLSGPEPQRTILEEKIITQLENYLQPVFIVRGLPGNSTTLQVNANVKYINHLPAKQLEEAIFHASFVIARSGYSSVMDLLKMQKKTILIPTPGQTEQEYLARHLSKQQLSFCTDQHTFDLEKSLKAASVFTYLFFYKNSSAILETALLFESSPARTGFSSEP